MNNTLFIMPLYLVLQFLSQNDWSASDPSDFFRVPMVIRRHPHRPAAAVAPRCRRRQGDGTRRRIAEFHEEKIRVRTVDSAQHRSRSAARRQLPFPNTLLGHRRPDRLQSIEHQPCAIPLTLYGGLTRFSNPTIDESAMRVRPAARPSPAFERSEAQRRFSIARCYGSSNAATGKMYVGFVDRNDPVKFSLSSIIGFELDRVPCRVVREQMKLALSSRKTAAKLSLYRAENLRQATSRTATLLIAPRPRTSHMSADI